MPHISSRLTLSAALAAGTVVAGAMPVTAATTAAPAAPAFAPAAAPAAAPATVGTSALAPRLRPVSHHAPQAASQQPSAVVSLSYQVQAGDTVWAIARRTGSTITQIVEANSLGSNALIRVGQMLVIPSPAVTTAPAPAAPQTAAPAAASTGGTVTIVRGDTLSGLAARHGTTVAALMAANGLTSTTIYAGRTLTLPGTTAPPTPAPTTAPGGTTTTQLVPSTFLHYTYPQATVGAANANKAALLAMEVPSREQMRQIVRETAVSMGVDPALALAIGFRESGFDQRAVSPANAIGTMQVIPSSGTWASTLVGRQLNLLDPRDNATAGVAIIRQLVRTSSSLDIAIASYYQGAGSVARNGMYSDTQSYVSGVKALMGQFGG